LEYLPSQANFVLVNLERDGEKICQMLLKKGMIVRSMKAYGFSNWIRVTVGRRSQNALFYRCLKAVLKEYDKLS
jgi:histidinol-phosphate aminotransferase